MGYEINEIRDKGCGIRDKGQGSMAKGQDVRVSGKGIRPKWSLTLKTKSCIS